jgi:hypothetical protein
MEITIDQLRSRYESLETGDLLALLGLTEIHCASWKSR